jgi:hypothetical protein
MMLAVRFLPEAATELDDAVNFYNTRKDGLGIDFAAEVRDGLARITQYPKAWQLLGSARQALSTSSISLRSGLRSAALRVCHCCGDAFASKAKLLAGAAQVTCGIG